MTPAEFAKLVIGMRAAQRAYFRTRDREVMVRAKELERRVDEAAPAIAEEPSLFGDAR